MSKTWNANRRSVLGIAAALAGAGALPGRLAAQDSGPIRFGALVPLSGAGGAWGPSINTSQRLVIDEVNAAGGVLGRKIELITEDSQTNPENAVRAAHKLIDADQVVTIMGTWASAVCSAVAPLCWQAHVMLIIIGAADSITELPHQGYIIRTQPNTHLQAEQFARFASLEAARHLYIMMPQTPFTASNFAAVSTLCATSGIKVSTAIYDAKKTSFRSEVDAMMRAAPDMVMAGGYQPDTIVLAKDIYRANYRGKVIGYAYAVNEQFVAGVGKAVAEGIFAVEPVPDAGSTAYARLAARLGRAHLDTYACQGYDEANLAVLAIAAARQASGTAIRDYVRRIGDPDGVKVDNAVDGMKALADGKTINYLGASGPCKFTPLGDVVSSNFRVTVVKDGAFVLSRAL